MLFNPTLSNPPFCSQMETPTPTTLPALSSHMDALTHECHLKDFISSETQEQGKVQLLLLPEPVSDMDLSGDDELHILKP